ncbi:MAG: SDR family oxidoreductase, partial [SAR324 cluster bacterium]|nr:SDR family oxidoreductase [SAR324 cluster bacterium]
MNERFVLITGASRGLGKVLSWRFAKEGYGLCLVAQKEKRLNELSIELKQQFKNEIQLISCDLGNSMDIDVLINKTLQKLPRLDVLINNAAIQGSIGPLWENDLDSWKSVINVNLMAPMALCRAFVPWMEANAGGSIINLSGGGATGPRPNFSAYASSKAALVRFSETLAEEVKTQSISVNCVAPGTMKTSMMNEIIEKGSEKSGEKEFSNAEKVIGEGGVSMDHVADLIVFLASKRNRRITGKLISAVWDNWEEWPNHLDEL